LWRQKEIPGVTFGLGFGFKFFGRLLLDFGRFRGLAFVGLGFMVVVVMTSSASNSTSPAIAVVIISVVP
jgi:hypothetical protein